MANDLTDPVLDALIATPLGRWMRRRRAKRMVASYPNGQPVTVRVSRRARPRDSWQSGEFIVSTGTVRQGVVVFSLSDSVELSVEAVGADLVRAAVANQAR